MQQGDNHEKNSFDDFGSGIFTGFTGVANAAENNPFGLVYKGAVVENVKGKVNIHPVTYMLNGLKIAANVYTPAGYA